MNTDMFLQFVLELLAKCSLTVLGNKQVCPFDTFHGMDDERCFTHSTSSCEHCEYSRTISLSLILLQYLYFILSIVELHNVNGYLYKPSFIFVRQTYTLQLISPNESPIILLGLLNSMCRVETVHAYDFDLKM